MIANVRVGPVRPPVDNQPLMARLDARRRVGLGHEVRELGRRVAGGSRGHGGGLRGGRRASPAALATELVEHPDDRVRVVEPPRGRVLGGDLPDLGLGPAKNVGMHDEVVSLIAHVHVDDQPAAPVGATAALVIGCVANPVELRPLAAVVEVGPFPGRTVAGVRADSAHPLGDVRDCLGATGGIEIVVREPAAADLDGLRASVVDLGPRADLVEPARPARGRDRELADRDQAGRDHECEDDVPHCSTSSGGDASFLRHRQLYVR